MNYFPEINISVNIENTGGAAKDVLEMESEKEI